MKQMRKVTSFKKEPIASELVEAMSRAALSAASFEESSFFFVFVENDGILEQMRALADGNAVYAPLAVFAFAKGSPISASHAFMTMCEKAEEEGLGVMFIDWPASLFNDPRHMEMKEAVGVPYGYACIGGGLFGFIETEESLTEDASYQKFSYIQ